MRSTTIVFRGLNQVVQAYVRNDTPAWAIVNGKDILAADAPKDVHEGEKMLEETLKALQEGNCRAAFDLKVYKVKPGTDILPNMEAHRAFRFTLYGDEELTPYEAGRKRALYEGEGRYQALELEIAELKKALAEKEEEDEPEPDGMQRAVAGITAFFETPIGRILQPRLAGLIERVIPAFPPPASPAQVAGIEHQLDRMSGITEQPKTMQQQAPEQLASLLDAEQLAKAQQAIAVLCSRDAKLGDHLEKLAQIAVDDPGQYQWLAGMLK